jgi:hypothetical protein
MAAISFWETTTIKEIEKTLWETIPPSGEFHLSYAFSEMMETAEMPGVNFNYVIVYSDDKPIYKLALMTFEVKLFRFFPKSLKNLLLKIRFPVALFGKFNILTIQSLFYLITSPVLDESALGEMTTNIIDKIKQIGKKNKSHIFLLYQKSVRGFLREFETIQGPFNAWMDVNDNWKSFEDYVNSMRHNHRKNLKRKQQECLHSNVTTSIRTAREVHPAESRELFLNVLYKYSNEVEQFNLLTAGYFDAIQRLQTDDFMYITAAQGSDFVGYVACTLDSERTLYLEFLGLDYKSIDSPVYFELLYSAIDFSIKNKIPKIDFGVDYLEAKLNLGAKAVKKDMNIISISRISRFIINCLKISPRLKDIFVIDKTVLGKNVFR